MVDRPTRRGLASTARAAAIIAALLTLGGCVVYPGYYRPYYYHPYHYYYYP